MLDKPELSSPRVTVLMPVYNGKAYLAGAIQSILDQTFQDFELLIMDDGSTDGSSDLVLSFADPRIRLLRNATNLGLVATLNKGLGLAQGDYIARMDCDDLSFSHRLERQVAFMDQNPEIGIAGSWFKRLGADEGTIAYRAIDDAEIRFSLIFRTTLQHSSVIIRRAILVEHQLEYDVRFQYAEDYEFWIRCGRYTKLANIPEILVAYRFHPENVSSKNLSAQSASAERVASLYLQELDHRISDEQLRIHFELLRFRVQNGGQGARESGAWLLTLAGIVETKLGLPGRLVFEEFEAQWYAACGNAAHEGWSAWRLFVGHPAGKRAAFVWKCKLWLRCLLRRRITVPVVGF
jgi:glycosyltransferase involved in cell wall biosynthesis